MTTDTLARIPNAIDTGTKLFGRFTLTDIAVALSPAVVISLAIQLLVPAGLTVAGVTIQSMALPLVVVGVAVGGAVLLVTPAYTDSLTWLEAIGSYLRRTRNRHHTDARDVAQIRQLRPSQEAIERSDGALIGLLAVEPAAMALATEAEWARKASAFGDFLETHVEFPVQFYATTQAVSTEEHLQPYRSRLEADRLDDELAELTASYVDWFESDMQQRASTVRKHYVVVAVPPDAVQFDDDSVWEPLRSVPTVGLFVNLWLRDPVPALRERQAEELVSRLRRLEAGIRGIEDCSARRLSVDAGMRAIACYWRDDEVVDAIEVPDTVGPVVDQGDEK